MKARHMFLKQFEQVGRAETANSQLRRLQFVGRSCRTGSKRQLRICQKVQSSPLASWSGTAAQQVSVVATIGQKAVRVRRIPGIQ